MYDGDALNFPRNGVIPIISNGSIYISTIYAGVMELMVVAAPLKDLIAGVQSFLWIGHSKLLHISAWLILLPISSLLAIRSCKVLIEKEPVVGVAIGHISGNGEGEGRIFWARNIISWRRTRKLS